MQHLQSAVGRWIVCGLLFTFAMTGCVSSGGNGDDGGSGQEIVQEPIEDLPQQPIEEPANPVFNGTFTGVVTGTQQLPTQEEKMIAEFVTLGLSVNSPLSGTISFNGGGSSGNFFGVDAVGDTVTFTVDTVQNCPGTVTSTVTVVGDDTLLFEASVLDCRGAFTLSGILARGPAQGDHINLGRIRFDHGERKVTNEFGLCSTQFRLGNRSNELIQTTIQFVAYDFDRFVIAIAEFDEVVEPSPSTTIEIPWIGVPATSVTCDLIDAAQDILFANAVVVTGTPPAPQCDDGIDNDGDGLIDLNDPGCAFASDNDETDTTVASGVFVGTWTGTCHGRGHGADGQRGGTAARTSRDRRPGHAGFAYLVCS